MIQALEETFPSEIAMKIFKFCRHPTAQIIKQHINEQFEYNYADGDYEYYFNNDGKMTKEELRQEYCGRWKAKYYFAFNRSRINNFKHKKEETRRIYREQEIEDMRNSLEFYRKKMAHLQNC
jgi:hypothetical protein